MKNLKMILWIMASAITMLSLSSCDDDEGMSIVQTLDVPFQDLTNDDIAATLGLMSSDPIEASNESGNVLTICDIIIYRTNGNHFGKLKILDIDDDENKKLTFEAVTYNADGSIFSETTNLEIRGTWTCDLDDMTEAGPNPDFHWQRTTFIETFLTPEDNAVFLLYK